MMSEGPLRRIVTPPNADERAEAEESFGRFCSRRREMRGKKRGREEGGRGKEGGSAMMSEWENEMG